MSTGRPRSQWPRKIPRVSEHTGKVGGVDDCAAVSAHHRVLKAALTDFRFQIPEQWEEGTGIVRCLLWIRSLRRASRVKRDVRDGEHNVTFQGIKLEHSTRCKTQNVDDLRRTQSSDNL